MNVRLRKRGGRPHEQEEIDRMDEGKRTSIEHSIEERQEIVGKYCNTGVLDRNK